MENLNLQYWKKRCILAEKFIEKTPCDPDIYPEQFEAFEEWQKLKQIDFEKWGEKIKELTSGDETEF